MQQNVAGKPVSTLMIVFVNYAIINTNAADMKKMMTNRGIIINKLIEALP